MENHTENMNPSPPSTCPYCGEEITPKKVCPYCKHYLDNSSWKNILPWIVTIVASVASVASIILVIVAIEQLMIVRKEARETNQASLDAQNALTQSLIVEKNLKNTISTVKEILANNLKETNNYRFAILRHEDRTLYKLFPTGALSRGFHESQGYFFFEIANINAFGRKGATVFPPYEIPNWEEFYCDLFELSLLGWLQRNNQYGWQLLGKFSPQRFETEKHTFKPIYENHINIPIPEILSKTNYNKFAKYIFLNKEVLKPICITSKITLPEGTKILTEYIDNRTRKLIIENKLFNLTTEFRLNDDSIDLGKRYVEGKLGLILRYNQYDLDHLERQFIEVSQDLTYNSEYIDKTTPDILNYCHNLMLKMKIDFAWEILNRNLEVSNADWKEYMGLQ